MTEDTTNNPSRSSWPIVVVLVLVFVVYPLSIGPAALILDALSSARLGVAMEIFYEPLSVLASRNDMLGFLLDSYVNWWRS
jgi:hypothetical protein